MRKRIATVTVLVAAVLLCGGCSRGLKEGAGLILGARGNYVPLQPAARARSAPPLGAYSSFQLAPLEDNFGGRVPPEMLRALPGRFREQLAKAKLPVRPGGKTLLIRGRIYHYESENLVGTIISPLEEVVARMELVDKKTGKVIAVANCVGRSKEATNKGPTKKADGLAKGIVKWLASGYPKPE